MGELYLTSAEFSVNYGIKIVRFFHSVQIKTQ